MEYADAKLCTEVLEVDINALYLGCMVHMMPTGTPRRQLEKKVLVLDHDSEVCKAAYGWLEHQAWSTGERG